MGKAQRSKGARVERLLVNALVKEGIDAKRIPLSGACSGFEGDISIKPRQGYRVGQDYVCEVKSRKNGEGFATLERWLGKNDFLFLKRDREQPIVVMQWDQFVRLMKSPLS
jgi:Holliday junction resolvase